MAENTRKKIQLYRTNSIKSVATDLSEGELALNLNSSSPYIMFENSDGKLEKVGVLTDSIGNSEYHTMSQQAVTEHVTMPSNYSVEYPTIEGNDGVVFSAITSGESVVSAIEKVDSNVVLLVNGIIKDEETISSAFTEIKESVGLDENFEYVTYENGNYISSATNLYGADMLLDAAISELKDDVDNIVESSNEVYVGESEPTIDSIELFIDESVNPLSVEVYSKSEVDTKIDALNETDSTLTSSINSKVVYGDTTDDSSVTDLFVDTSSTDEIEVYTRAQVDAIIAKLKADNNLI